MPGRALPFTGENQKPEHQTYQECFPCNSPRRGHSLLTGTEFQGRSQGTTLLGILCQAKREDAKWVGGGGNTSWSACTLELGEITCIFSKRRKLQSGWGIFPLRTDISMLWSVQKSPGTSLKVGKAWVILSLHQTHSQKATSLSCAARKCTHHIAEERENQTSESLPWVHIVNTVILKFSPLKLVIWNLAIWVTY